MAEMLIDGAKLDACNTAEADAIRAKTGGTSPIPYDYENNKGFADAIAAIPSGGGSGSQNQVPKFYVYLKDGNVYRDITGSRVTNAQVAQILANGNTAAKKSVKNVYGNSTLYNVFASLTFYFAVGAGASSNLISVGNKVNTYNSLHFGFSSTANLNSPSDNSLRDLIPTSFNASGSTPNYLSWCKGYIVSQITITVSNPSDEDFIVNSVFVSSPSKVGSTQTRNDVTGNEHCV